MEHGISIMIQMGLTKISVNAFLDIETNKNQVFFVFGEFLFYQSAPFKDDFLGISMTDLQFASILMVVVILEKHALMLKALYFQLVFIWE